MNKKQATKLRNDAIMSLVNSGSTSIWPAQVVALDLEDVKCHDGKMQIWLVRRNGSKRFETLGREEANVLRTYIEQGRQVLRPATGELALFVNRLGRGLTTRSIRNIVNEFAPPLLFLPTAPRPDSTNTKPALDQSQQREADNESCSAKIVLLLFHLDSDRKLSLLQASPSCASLILCARHSPGPA